MEMSGKVYLVGAGPGDPGLLTLKGKGCIEEADVVVYDHLANPALLQYARKEAEIIYAGKTGGCHTLSQEEIQDLIVNRARKGKIVARLKGGDPFIFGRGGEEALTLKEAGIEFEVVPGVSAASAVPAYAGIPITHRGLASSVAFVTGHEDPDKPESAIRWDKLATGGDTLVFFMGMKNLSDIVQNLIRNGRAKETPVAVVEWGTTPRQRTATGTLENIQETVKESDIQPPSVIVVGDVVGLREKLKWFEDRPLLGRRIIVTRSRDQASEFVRLLEKQGAEAIEFPTIQTVPPDNFDELDGCMERLDRYDWLIFTSVNGVHYFMDRLTENGRDVRDLKGLKICAIGPKTADAVRTFHLKVDYVPKEFLAESILEGFPETDLNGKRILIPRAAEAREVLPDELTRRGAAVDVAETYRTIQPTGRKEEVLSLLKEGRIDAIAFTSSSTVKNFFGMFDNGERNGLLNGVAVASIGPITAETAREFGLTPTIQAKSYTIEGLTEAIVDYFRPAESKR
jgi:uroporphyrinogen III methyltransferase/synthase